MDIEISNISADELVSLLERQSERKISDELNDKALHTLLEGRCAGPYGCSKRA